MLRSTYLKNIRIRRLVISRVPKYHIDHSVRLLTAMLVRHALRRAARLAPSFTQAVTLTAVAGGAAGAASAYAYDDDDENPFAPGYAPPPPPNAAPPNAAGAADDGPGPSPWSKAYTPPAPAGSAGSAVIPAGMTPQLKAGRNVVLGDTNIAEELRPHRVALCEWPCDQAKHNGEYRTSSPRVLFRWIKKSGYDGIEATAPWFASKFFPNMSMDEVAVRTTSN